MYNVDSSTIFSKHIYRYDQKRCGFFESVSENKLLASSGNITEFEVNMRENWDENYDVHLVELEETRLRTDAEKERTAEEAQSNIERGGGVERPYHESGTLA